MTTPPEYRCPVCDTPSELVAGPRQAFCTNEHGCSVVMWNPSFPDGGPSEATVVDLGEFD
ncbi:MAG: hypothetical protein ACRDSF_00655 [Pseudonocardiaceae bacterium]